MDQPQERIIHCHACSRYIQLAEGDNVGDTVACPFCETKNVIATMTVYIGKPVEEG